MELDNGPESGPMEVFGLRDLVGKVIEVYSIHDEPDKFDVGCFRKCHGSPTVSPRSVSWASSSAYGSAERPISDPLALLAHTWTGFARSAT